MEQLLVNRCDFCMHRNGMVCTVSHRDCKPGIEPCPYEDEKLYPCKYKATDSVRRYLGNLGVRTEIKDKTPDYERVEEAQEILDMAIEEKERRDKKPRVFTRIKNLFKK